MQQQRYGKSSLELTALGVSGANLRSRKRRKSVIALWRWQFFIA
jgi:hypothetical protein